MEQDPLGLGDMARGTGRLAGAMKGGLWCWQWRTSDRPPRPCGRWRWPDRSFSLRMLDHQVAGDVTDGEHGLMWFAVVVVNSSGPWEVVDLSTIYQKGGIPPTGRPIPAATFAIKLWRNPIGTGDDGVSDPWKIAGVGDTAGMTFDRRYAQRLFGERRYTAARRRPAHHRGGYADGQGGSAYLGDAPLLLAPTTTRPTGKAGRPSDLIAADPTEVYAVLLLARTLQRRGRHSEAGSWLRRRCDGLTRGRTVLPSASDDRICRIGSGRRRDLCCLIDR